MNTYYPGFNPYLQNQFQQNPMYQAQNQQQFVNQVQNQQTQPAPQSTPVYKPTSIGLQGKSVDSIEVVKASEIPLDGTISYFPLTDGSAIVTKQLQMDGTSKTVVYKPVEVEEPTKQDTPKYITSDELDERLKNIDSGKDYKEDIKSLKKQMKDLSYDFDKLSEQIKERED